jgi:flagellar hook-associated protein 2
MAIGLDGLASGLNTAELIASLLAVDAIPQTLLKNKATVATTAVTAFQGLNTQIAALATQAGKSATSASLDFYTPTSSSTAVTVTAGTGASGGTIDLVVGSTAQSQAAVTAPLTTWSTPAVLTIVSGDGTATEITPASSSLDDVVKAVNASGAGVVATKVAAGRDADGTPQYRLQFSGAATGAAGSFTVHDSAEADVSAANDLLARPGSALVREARDASITLWSGTSAEQTLTSATNTFADLLPGVSVTVSAASAVPVTVTVARDTAKVSGTAAALVDSLNTALAYISTRSVAVASTDADGKPILSGGVFTGDGTTRTLTQSLLDAASAPVAGHSPSEYGISITKHGTMEFDAEKFAAAFAADPLVVQSAVAEISARIASAAGQASDKTTGTITAKITGQQSTVTSLNEQVARWDDRLAARKGNLQRMYTAFEVSMSNLNSQMTWLTDQVDALKAAKD